MKVLLASIGTRGDVQPLAVLAAALQTRGHEVMLAAPPESEPVVRALGVPFTACGRDVTRFIENMDVSALSPREVMREFEAIVAGDLQAQMRILAELAKGARVVVTAGLQLCGSSVAELHGARACYAYYAPLLLPSSEHAPFLVPWQSLPRFVNALLHDVAYALLSRATLRSLNDARVEVGLARYAHLGHTLPADLLVAWDEELAARPRDRHRLWDKWRYTPMLHEVGALQPPAAALDDELARFVDAQPTVYVGFGSMPDTSADETMRTIAGACARLGVSGVVGTRGVLPDDATHLRAWRAGSHAALFPRMQAVVHHGGAGTSATAARAGVPQVVVPHFVDQPFWAIRLEKLGVAPPSIPRGRFDVQRLTEALGRCLDDRALKERARALGETLRAVDPPARGAAVVERIGQAAR